MIPNKKTGKAFVTSIVVLAALSLTLTACSAPSASKESAIEEDALGNTYIIEGFTGADCGSDAVPQPNAKMLTVPSVELSYPTDWTIVEAQTEEYSESQYGIMSNEVILEGPAGLRVSIMLGSYKGGGACDGNIEVVGPTGIDDVWFVWVTNPEYGFSHPQYINRKYIDEQEAGSLSVFPSLAYLQEGYLYGSIFMRDSSNADRKNYAENADLDAAVAILESVRLA